MHDQETFEPRFTAAVGRYLQDAPIEVDAVALAHATAVASRRAGTRRFPIVNTALRFVLIGAIAGAALLGISLAGGQKITAPLPSPSICAAPAAGPSLALPASPLAVGSSGAGASPVEFLWSATGGANGIAFALTGDGTRVGGTIGIDAECRIWVADTGHDRFAIFDPDGTFLEYWGSSGEGDGQFNLRRSGGSDSDGYGAVAFAPDASFYVLDVGNHRVQHFGADRTFLGSWNGPGPTSDRFVDPVGLSVDHNGLVYVLDDVRDVVERYDKEGSVVASFSPKLAGYNSANGLALDGVGNVYVSACCSAPNQVKKFDRNGTLLSKTPSISTASYENQLDGIAVDSSMRMFVTLGPPNGGDRVRVYDADGKSVASFGSLGSGDGQFGDASPLGIALDGQGNIYVTDGPGNRLEKFRLLPPLAP